MTAGTDYAEVLAGIKERLRAAQAAVEKSNALAEILEQQRSELLEGLRALGVTQEDLDAQLAAAESEFMALAAEASSLLDNAGVAQ